jgi:hypothetical protein
LPLAESEEFVQIGDLNVVWWDFWGGGEVAVEGKAERSTDGRHTPDDVGSVDWRGIPCVVSTVDGFTGYFKVVISLVNGNGDGFIKKTEEPLH